MTAKGKRTATDICINIDKEAGTVRILITDNEWGKAASTSPAPGCVWLPARNKTGMVTALVTGYHVEKPDNSRQQQYVLHTDQGNVMPVPGGQTFWLATDTPAPAPVQPGGTRKLLGTAVAPSLGEETADASVEVPEDSMLLTMSHVDEGDVVSLPGETTRRTVQANVWLGEDRAHQLVFTDGYRRAFPAADAPPVVLHERPGCGPFSEVYKVGDRVMVKAPRYSQHQWYVGKVVSVTPIDEGLHLGGFLYEVRTIMHFNSPLACGVEDMRRETTPWPAVGQVWATLRDGKEVTVTGVDREYDGLAAYTNLFGRVELSSEHYRLVSSPTGEGDELGGLADGWDAFETQLTTGVDA